MADENPSAGETMQRAGLGAGLAIGMGVGVAMGVGFGNMGLGIGLGVAIGTSIMVAFAAAGNRLRRDSGDAADPHGPRGADDVDHPRASTDDDDDEGGPDGRALPPR